MKRTVSCLKTEKRMWIEMTKKLIFDVSQATISGGRAMDQFLKRFSPVYLGFPLKIEETILTYCSRKVPEL